MSRRRTNQDGETLIPLTFPLQGINETASFGRQRPGTTIDALNVRSFDPLTDRARGARRAGMSKYLTDVIAEDSETGLGTPIQNINTLSTTDVPPGGGTDSLTKPFVYSLAVNNGFGLASGLDGTSIIVAPPAPESGFIFNCSCWDDQGNVYVGMHNKTTGVARIYKANAAGVIQWPTTALPSVGNTLVFGTLGATFRCVVGMTCITAVHNGITERFLYVAFRDSAGASAYVLKFNCATGLLKTRPGFPGGSYVASVISNFSNMRFSSNAHNCLGSLGTLLGIDDFGANSFRMFDTNDYTTDPYGLKAFGVLAYGGTAAAAHSKVVSDGTDYFYVIMSSNGAQKVRKIGTNFQFHPTWSSATVTAGGTITGLTFDRSLSSLMVTATTNPSVRHISLANGAQITSGTMSPPVAPATPITQWDEIDCDGQGTFVLWRNSQATDNVMALNSTYATFWGQTNLSNALHYGASMSKASAPSSPPAQTTPSSRQVRSLAVADGRVFEFDFVAPKREVPLGTAAVAFSKTRRQIFSAPCNLDLFYVDGAIYQYYKSSTSEITAWTLTAGLLPVDATERAARLICNWRGRLVLSGLIGDPNNWFMCVPHNPFDFDYAATFSEKTAYAGSIAGEATDAGNLDDIVNALVPYSDDLLIFGGDHSITQLTGDPAAGGRLDTISDRIGMAFGKPFCKDPVGQLYFFSSQSGVYLMSPGAYPVQLSQAIKVRMENVNVAKSHINLAWDLKNQGLAVFITPDDDGPTTHYFWEERTGSWFPDFYADTGLDPFCVFAFDGDQPNDAAVMLGSRDGYIRVLDNFAVNDDGRTIDSYLYIGPLMTENLDDIFIRSLQAVLGADSGPVSWDVYVGTTAEAAYASEPVDSGTWQAGRNNVTPVGWAGHAIYIRLSSSSPWAMEVIQASIRTQGKIARRSGGNTT